MKVQGKQESSKLRKWAGCRKRCVCVCVYMRCHTFTHINDQHHDHFLWLQSKTEKQKQNKAHSSSFWSSLFSLCAAFVFLINYFWGWLSLGHQMVWAWGPQWIWRKALKKLEKDSMFPQLPSQLPSQIFPGVLWNKIFICITSSHAVLEEFVLYHEKTSGVLEADFHTGPISRSQVIFTWNNHVKTTTAAGFTGFRLTGCRL